MDGKDVVCNQGRKQALIDIGSNSMRLTVYYIEGEKFRSIFKEKYMAGLAGYVEKGKLSPEGIREAVRGLNQFKGTIQVLEIRNVAVFATASLRNIENTQAAVREINKQTGFSIEVIPGEEEAVYGYMGAMAENHFREGKFLDIGGASTEFVAFCGEKIFFHHSYPIGSLKLYKENVRGILPRKKECRAIIEQVEDKVNKGGDFPEAFGSRLFCAGGTARAVLKMIRKICPDKEADQEVTIQEIRTLTDYFKVSKKQTVDLILRTEPERIHTMIPGLLILNYFAERCGAENIYIGKYGVREGYLWKNIIGKREGQTGITVSPRTEN